MSCAVYDVGAQQPRHVCLLHSPFQAGIRLCRSHRSLPRCSEHRTTATTRTTRRVAQPSAPAPHPNPSRRRPGTKSRCEPVRSWSSRGFREGTHHHLFPQPARRDRSCVQNKAPRTARHTLRVSAGDPSMSPIQPMPHHSTHPRSANARLRKACMCTASSTTAATGMVTRGCRRH